MNYQELFDHMAEEHSLILIESEMREIVIIVRKMLAQAEKAKEEQNKAIDDIFYHG